MTGTMKAAFAVVLMLGVVTVGEAQINQRQHRQHRRIVQGARSGELTSREALRLRREQARIRRQESRARRDGELTAMERARIQRELNRANRHIYREKHDRQERN
jgi:hypothetical protein